MSRFEKSSDDGFTLIELLVAIVILGIILVPLTGAIMAGLFTTRDTGRRLAETVSAVFTSSFWAADVQSATEILPGGTACGTTTGTNVVTFTWANDAVSPQAVRRASYVAENVTVFGEATVRLVRISCPPAGDQTRIVVAPTLREVPTLECLNEAGAAVATCTQPLNPLLGPTRIKNVNMKLATPGKYLKGGTRPLEFSVTGTRRST